MLIDADEGIVAAFYNGLDTAQRQTYYQDMRKVTIMAAATSGAVIRERNQYLSKLEDGDTIPTPTEKDERSYATF